MAARKPAKASRADYRERRIRAQDGLELYFRDYGDPTSAAAPMMCLTGLTRNSKDYHSFASTRAADRRVICLDYRGRGQSARDADWKNYRPEIYLNDIRAVLAACNAHHVISVGTSLGAILTMGLSVLAPTLLAGAILNDAGPELDAEGLTRIVAYVGEEVELPDWNAAVAKVQSMFPSLSISGKAAWRAFAERTFREGEDGVIRYDWDTALVKNLVAGNPMPDLWPLYRGLRNVPVLALRGALSDVLSEDTFERMADDMPNLTRVTVPDVGHVPTLEEPAARSAIDKFLKTI